MASRPRAVRRSVRQVETSVGPARVHRFTPAGTDRSPILVLGHGAGGGIEATDLQGLTAHVVHAGFPVALVEQPWRVASGRVAPRPATLDAAWTQVLAAVRHRGPLVTGGRSAGARVALRTADAVGARGVVALAFPLHPPGRVDRSRADEAVLADRPLLIVQGTRDPFGTADEVAAAVPATTVVPVLGGDHSLGRLDLTPAWAAVVDLLSGLPE